MTLYNYISYYIKLWTKAHKRIQFEGSLPKLITLDSSVNSVRWIKNKHSDSARFITIITYRDFVQATNPGLDWQSDLSDVWIMTILFLAFTTFYILPASAPSFYEWHHLTFVTNRILIVCPVNEISYTLKWHEEILFNKMNTIFASIM